MQGLIVKILPYGDFFPYGPAMRRGRFHKKSATL